MEPWTYDHIHERPKQADPQWVARAIIAAALAWGFVLTSTVGTAYSGLRFGKQIARKVKRKVCG